ncbi:MULTISPECIES: type III pantothenate kinase [Rubrivirga]|uniref:Type III pantothenate kinase n=1 Tax=Rubrivirga litoralis TaxID=3075598 RepID=A0ABU3BUA1_9BACT|nr:MULTISPECIES: type III pantothenate kinase [unclassified Rubrivirga]MDT0632857.1 type III pantothenate kinase [Rubrivirga sp. F394]
MRTAPPLSLPHSQFSVPISSLPPFLALDAGNSSVKAGVWAGRWVRVERWPSDGAPPEVWAGRFRDLSPCASAVGIASVVPALTPALAEAAEAAWSAPPAVVSAALPLPFRLAYQTPSTLGADRLAAAAAAWALVGGQRPVVALDAGTAVTLDVVSAEPAYLGGAILPGPDLLRRSLARGTGQLPDIAWAAPPEPVGASTAESIQAGLTAALVGGVERLLRQTAEALGARPALVVTGGWGPWMAERVPGVDRVEPHLVLDGVRLLTAPPQ